MSRITHPLLRRRDRETAATLREPDQEGPRLRAVPPPPVGAPAAAAVPDLALQIRRGGRRSLVVVSGELDSAGRELLDAVLAHVRSTEPGSVDVDLGQVTFADTHGLAAVLGRDVVLVDASPAVARLLRLLGLPLPRPRSQRPALGRPGRRGRTAGPS